MCIASCKINYPGSKWRCANLNATSDVYGCEFSFNYLSLFDLEVEGLKVNIKLIFSACQKYILMMISSECFSNRNKLYIVNC